MSMKLGIIADPDVDSAVRAAKKGLHYLEYCYNGGNDVAVFDARLHQRVLVVADALHRRPVEVAPEVVERLRTPIDHAHICPGVGEHVGQARPDASATHDDHVAHLSPFR